MRIHQFNQRVILGYALLTVLTFMAGLAGNHFLRVKDEGSFRREESLSMADQLLAGSKTLTINVRAFAATGDSRYRDAFIDEQTVTRSRDKAVEGLFRLHITTQELALIDEAKRNSDKLISLEQRAFAAGEAGDLKRAIQLVYGPDYLSALDSIYGPIERFRQALRDRLIQESRVLERNADVARWVVGVLLSLNVVMVSSLLMLFYRRSVISPIVRLNAEVRGRLAGGDVRIDSIDDDTEIGDLARSLAELCALESRMNRQRQNKIQVAELSLALLQTQGHHKLSQVLFSRLSDLLEIRCALLHLWDQSNGELCCVGSYGLSTVELGRRIPSGSGLAGECARQRKPMCLEEVPADYFRIISGTGSALPRELMVRPLMMGGQLFGVMELAALRKFGSEDMELLEDIERVLVMRLAHMGSNGEADQMALMDDGN